MKTNFIQLYRMADVEVAAKLKLDGDAANKTMKDFKNEIKAANEELLNTQARFGATSKEALAAAKKVAMLKDNIQDANETAKLFDPSNRFQAVGNAVRGLVGGFTALQGALALVGVAGDDVQKTLLKVQGALALTEGLNTIADVGKDFKRLGSTIVQTLGKSGLIGVAIAGVAALGLALAGVFDGASLKTKELNKSLKELEKGEVEATVEVNKLTNSFKQAELGIISKDDALKMYNEGMGKTVGQAKDLNEAEKLVADNAAAYIKVQGLKAQANYILQKSSEMAAEAAIAEAGINKIKNTGGIYGAALDVAKGKIEEQKVAAKELDGLISGINSQIVSASSGFKSPVASGSAGKGGSTTKVAVAKKEDDELKGIALLRAERETELREKELAEIEATKNRKISIDTELKASSELTSQSILDSYKAEEEARWASMKLAEEEAAAKARMTEAVSNGLVGLSQLIGEQTAAGKIFAIASATINTYAAIAAQLKTFSGVPIPGYAIAQAIATGIFGLVQVKRIIGVKVPGKGGGGSTPSVSGATGAPLQPSSPQATNTLLNQNQLNQIGNAASRAFVLEADVSNNQERVRRLNRAARL